MGIRRAVKTGLFVETADGGALIGSKCKSCGRIFFPTEAFCFECIGEEMEEVTLSRMGKLYSYTVSHMPSSYFKAPYALGVIELPEGLKIISPLKDWEHKSLKVGMEMKLVIENLCEEQGEEIIGFKFLPTS